MPLIDPVTQSQQNSPSNSVSQPNQSDDLDELRLQTMGKTLGEEANETTFAKKDLPTNTRVVNEGDFVTQDHQPDRTTVRVGEDGTVKEIKKG
ncbi:MAG: hypothetical protein Q9159_002027 [Coniocarpon cinnabarinum]